MTFDQSSKGINGLQLFFGLFETYLTYLNLQPQGAPRASPHVHYSQIGANHCSDQAKDNQKTAEDRFHLPRIHKGVL